jgi:hypothetical protein
MRCDYNIHALAGNQRLTPVILATQEAVIRRSSVCGQPMQTVHRTLSQKYPNTNQSCGVVQVVEGLLSKHEALNSNPGAPKKFLSKGLLPE